MLSHHCKAYFSVHSIHIYEYIYENVYIYIYMPTILKAVQNTHNFINAIVGWNEQ